jgi:hypothetical protein
MVFPSPKPLNEGNQSIKVAFKVTFMELYMFTVL